MGPVRLDDLTLPACLLGAAGRDGLLRGSLALEAGRIVEPRPDMPRVDMRGAMAFPAFVDMHTHLDKGHVWPRAANPDGTFMGALTTVHQDHANWSARDVRARMDFALRCAFAHGTRAIRTHLDSGAPQDRISWPVFEEVREAWRGRIELQAACLVGCEAVDAGGPFRETADRTAAAGGVLGMVTCPVPTLPERLDAFLTHAVARGLDVDFHADETLDPASNTLRAIAEAVIARSFDRPVTVGHLCSLSTMPEDEAMTTLDLVAEAGLNVVSLPMCNLYLQDRQAGRTPRNRGVTLVHEMKARGINVSFASDNTRDPFYAYGDLDMLEVMREATRLAHLDHADPDWALAFTANPARACGFAAPSLAPGAPADLVLCNARSWTELFARPQQDRVVLRGGRPIDRTLPDYAELDALLISEPAPGPALERTA
jgi:cytosine deaminase